MGALGQVSFFVALILVIVIHEAAHFGVAKAFGIKVTEFFVGFGPRIWSTKRGDTEYGFKWIPAGGYVKIAGMNPYETVPAQDVARAYGSKPIWQRALVILAGPLSHALVGALLYFTLFVTYGDPNTDLVVVGEVTPTLDGSSSPALEAGLQVGDVVTRVGDLEDPTPDSLGRYVTRYAEDHPGEPLAYVIDRDGRSLTLEIVPRLVTEDEVTRGRIGFTLGAEDLSIPGSVVESGEWVGRAAWASVETIPKIFTEGVGRTFSVLFSDEPRKINDPTSLVGVSRQIGDAGAQGDWGLFLNFAAYVTIFIGVVNLIPLPPLDGGHLMLLAWEKVTGRQADYRKLVPVSAAVIVFLSVFAIATVFLDITEPLPII